MRCSLVPWVKLSGTGRWPAERARIRGIAYRDGDDIVATPAASTATSSRIGPP